MAGIFELGSLWIVIKDVFSHFSRKASEKKSDTIEAHKAVNSAFIKTFIYIL